MSYNGENTERIWKFDGEEYEQELIRAWKEEEEGKKRRNSSTSLIIIRSKRTKSGTSSNCSNFEESEKEEANDISLNDTLATCERNLGSLIGTLIKWRTRKWFIVADIKAMFHQVRLQLEDMIYCGIAYWEKDVKKTNLLAIKNFITFVIFYSLFVQQQSSVSANTNQSSSD